MAWPAAHSSTPTSAPAGGCDAPHRRRRRRRCRQPPPRTASLPAASHNPCSASARPLALAVPRWQPLTLVDIKTLSHNTRRYRFALPHQEQELGLPLGQHISIKATDAEGRDVMR